MPPTMPPTRRQVNVLITGFGPFMSVVTNPSWLSVKPLHNMRLCSTTPDRTSESGEGVRIQTLQVPVHYSSVLDLVPRLHGRTPRSGTFWHDPRLDSPHGGTAGQVYPDGYPIDHPASGYDVVIHVGVGRGGSIRLESLAHKHSYDKPDTASSLAPSLSPSRRGFGEGYEEFADIEQTTINIGELVGWLKRKGLEVDQSWDAGRYVCDFIYYASLTNTTGAKVLFIHVPPVEDGPGVETCTEVIRNVAWYLATQSS
ncbi:peptidase C15, pyroglutamyl peptidase I-like protein [Moesziomyces antarcticus]|uniref:Peptidase C15, pyroglutamyl peptidase I-like protein n=2 Tax=Pseudozyma antarctica TaxID=84753 RepID=A0A081CBS5_PSEA2|nr:peptidase C15, pyroglutamyl peptidase I-like protein [Moesziomyces antarcticus]GAK64121.1 peptidase C15, pyroglutamyl peptidase I-like protein [Moesziomyces antarcticus]SPO44660.1 uncharacterized protein PSANT_02345 [Moesziomyces antarcticus]